MTCAHLGKQTGTANTDFGLEPQYACNRAGRRGTTLARCTICKDYLSKAALPQKQPGVCVHPTGVVVNRYGREAGVADFYKGASCFLVLGGPSLKKMRLELLARRGVLIMSVNNCPGSLPAGIRPHIWLHTDPTGKFHDSIWRDPGVLKFTPVREWNCAREKKNRGIRKRNEQGKLVHLPGVKA